MPVNKTPLPLGLTIGIQQSIRNFEFKLRSSQVSPGDASLHGLYNDSQNQQVISDDNVVQPAVQRKVFPLPFSQPDPVADERKRFSNNCMYLPNVLHEAFGLTILDARIEQFYKRANEANTQLKARIGKKVTPDYISKAEGYVNTFATRCIELKVQCIRVTRDNPKGSHKRSDGLFSKTTVMRTVYLNQGLNDAQLMELMNKYLLSPTVIGQSTIGNYRIKGADNGSVFLEAVVSRNPITN